MSTTLHKVLILEENTDHLELLTSILEEHFTPIDIHTVESIEDCLDFLEKGGYHLVFTGYYIHSTPITERLESIVLNAAGAPVIVISGSGDEAIAAQAIKLGASEYLVKNKKTMEKIPSLVAKYFKKGRQRGYKPKTAIEGAEFSNRLLREMDHLMQRARNLTAEVATKTTNVDTSSIESLFSQIRRLRKLIQEPK